MQKVKTISEMPRTIGKKFYVPSGHEIQGYFARNGYPDDILERILCDNYYEVVAQWANQIMIASCSEDDSFCSSKYRYVIVLD